MPLLQKGSLLLNLLLLPLVLFFSTIGSAQADPLILQRLHYQQIKKAWDQGNSDEVERLLPTLVDYPLYPYLRYRQLSDNFDHLTLQEVQQFRQTYPTLPLSGKLITRFTQLQVKQRAWQNIIQLLEHETNSLQARCYYYHAQWATGKHATMPENFEHLWLSKTPLPSSCLPLYKIWRKQGLLTPALMMQKIFLLAHNKENYQSLLESAALSKRESTLLNKAIKLNKHPTNLLTFAQQSPTTPFTQYVVMTLFPRWLNAEPEKAKKSINALVKAKKLSASQKLMLEKVVVATLFVNGITTDEANWRDRIIANSKESRLIERRIRFALANNDLSAVTYWINKLPAQEQQKQEWRYWSARLALVGKNQHHAENRLKQLATERGFYPMVAAQLLQQPYQIRMTSVEVSATQQETLQHRPEIRRVEELLYWGERSLARQEWLAYLQQADKTTIEQLAHYALLRGFADLSVQATIKGQLWDHLNERFPIAYSTQFDHALKDKTISKAFAMAIARQESGWIPEIRSPVGATGLMQLMPKTAEATARSMKLNTFKPRQLIDPTINILLGSHYLEEMYHTFSGNRILAAAAYNAGPHRVNRWLSNSAGRLDAIAFIESIPFHETRNYVKNVLCYDVFYSHFMNNQHNVLETHELQRQY